MFRKSNNAGFDVIIGLELHIQLDTKTKLFSPSLVTFGSDSNTSVNIQDVAFPGTMPALNKQAVIFALQLASVLHMDIANTLVFERKNYFYSDLPRGYQITQQSFPLGSGGYLLIKNGDEERKIPVERLHLEDDTCKQSHLNGLTHIDFNRSGVPLVEIVTEPVIHSSAEACVFVSALRQLVEALGVSSGKMENGALRCDVNISMSQKGKPGTKVEIKNLNTLSDIKDAIDFEIIRQSSFIKEGKAINQETRRFDETNRTTVLMRNKSDNIDYKFFIEPNIPPIRLTADFILNAISHVNELPEQRLNRYISLGLSKDNAMWIVKDISACKYFDLVILHTKQAKTAFNFISRDIKNYLNRKSLSFDDCPISPRELAEFANTAADDRFSSSQTKTVIDRLLEGEHLASILSEIDCSILSDKEIKNIVNNVLNHNKNAILDYNSGKDKALGYIIGKVINAANGRVDPVKAKQIVLEEIQRR